MRGHQAPGGLDPVEPGHPHVHEDDVRPSGGHHLQRLQPVTRLTDDVHAGSLEDQGEPAAHQLLVVDHHDPQHRAAHGVATGRTARTVKPDPVGDSATSAPP